MNGLTVTRIDVGNRHDSIFQTLLELVLRNKTYTSRLSNQDANDWALSFWDDFDIQCEAKAKNGLIQLYERAVETKK